ncbi:MAG: AAA family ATPase, partial [Deltaproteobacteria bacterium]|nr:AAA family ATPase [Deltaproteobacteria bacterium]
AEGIKFCGDCGYDLRKVQEPPSDAYIHPQSYTPKFLADKILTTKSAIEGERKLVTVLFADVANYTSMSEKLDPEQVHQIMDGCFKILMDEIHDHEGTINQFTGDGVMALFGAPLALENNAQRACYAALSIQKAMVGYSNEVKKDFDANFEMRVGLNSGTVVVGSIGDDLRMDYTAIGNTTNLAARMESMAEPGTVLVSNNTYKRVKQHFEFTPPSKKTIKGKETPQDVYRLVDKIHRSKISSERMIQSEIVGRQVEMDRLELHVLKAINGEGSIVNIIGEAGLGKSRLIAELKTMNALRRVAVFEGRALSIGRNLGFYPIIEILKNWAKIDENDSETESIYKLESAVKNIYPEQADEIFPFIATLMGMKPFGKHAERLKGIEGEALEKLIQKNLRDLIAKASQLSPIIFIVEDLHWADNSSLELMQTLFRLAKDNRILFINVFRPFHKDTGEKLLDSVKEKYPGLHTEIFLKPLDNNQCDLLIDNLLMIKRTPGDMKGLIKKRAEGNPFFIEEVIRSFIDEGIVELKNGEFIITRKIESVVIPSTINELVMSRIDRLDERIKSLVKTASVIGRNFFHKILVEIADTVDDIDDKLGYLKEVQLILERRRMEEIEYLFKHALAQEAAYESILLKKRKELHLKVATSIERVFNKRLQEFYGMLAFHYSRGEEYEKAEEYLIKAGEEALKSSASSEALHYYQE